jgi:serine/threonine protein kinase/cytochrome c-type biogenesis protein CcmH/NrfG
VAHPIKTGSQQKLQSFARQPIKWLVIRARFADYEIISPLGRGGMGQLYLAQDTRLPRRVALKTLSPELAESDENLRRFEQEAWAASSLNHPNILTIYEVGRHDGKSFIASEFVEGVNLRQRLANRLDVLTVLDIAIQAAYGLKTAHAAGIVHRDIKPENLMIRHDGLLKIVDFGLARITERRSDWQTSCAEQADSATQAGVVLGTTKYMSPEQARGLPADASTDIFSLGAVIYEMLAGKSAFEGETDSDRIVAILLKNPPPLAQAAPDAPPELRRVVERAISKDKEKRYQSADELLRDLQNIQKNLEIKNALRSRRFTWSAIALAVICCVVIAIVLFLRWKTPSNFPHLRVLAVLPLQSLSHDPDSDFLGFSLADTLITKLGDVSSIVVRPSSAVEKYRNRVVDPLTAASDLKADVLLTGNYLCDGDRLRINVQLIEAKQSRILWQDTFETRLERLLQVQDQVAQQIIRLLALRLTPTEAANIQFDNPIGREAYEDYLRGVDLYATDDFSGAIRLLERSASLDPNYAPTWAHLGQAYTTNASLEFGGRIQYQKAQEAYEKALSLDPSLVEARVYMANLFTDTGRVEQSVPPLREALARNPNSADAHWELGYAYRFAGMLPESVRECELARQIDTQVKLYSSAINSYLYLGEYDRFLASLPQSNAVYILFYRGLGDYYKQAYRAALSHFDEAYDANPSLFQAFLGEAFADAIRHRYAEGAQILRQLEARTEERGVRDPEGIYKIAQAFAVLGQKQEGIHALKVAIQGGFFCYPYFRTDPLIDNLRREPEFNTVLDSARERHARFVARFGGAK